MNTNLDDKLFDLQCLLQRAELVGNLGLEACPLDKKDQTTLVADLLWKIRQAQELVDSCVDVNN